MTKEEIIQQTQSIVLASSEYRPIEFILCNHDGYAPLGISDTISIYDDCILEKKIDEQGNISFVLRNHEEILDQVADGYLEIMDDEE